MNNGVICANRTWSAKLDEVKNVYQYVKFQKYDAATKQLTLKNVYDFTNLQGYILRANLLVDGTQVASYDVTLPSVAPDATKAVTIPVAYDYSQAKADGKEVLINFNVINPEATSYAEANYSVATAQFTIAERSKLAVVKAEATDGKLTLVNKDGKTTISNDKVTLSLYNSTGAISEWIQNGIKVAEVGPEYENYRWIENDAPYGGDPGYDQGNGITGHSASFKLANDGMSATATVKGTGTWANYVFVYTIYANGTVDLNAQYTPQNTQTAYDRAIRRLGMQMLFPGKFSNVSYYARGPLENYNDRQTGAFLGRYTTTVWDMNEYYLCPQSMGNRQDMRELVLSDSEGNRIKVESQGQVAFSTLYWSDQQLRGFSHNWELTVNPEVDKRRIYAHFDYMQRGLGSGSCGQLTTSNYIVPTSGTYGYTLRFTATQFDDTTVGVKPVANATDALRVSHSDEQLMVSGAIEAGTSVALYNVGGVRLGSAHASAAMSQLTLSLAGQPRGSYLVVIDAPSGHRVHKIFK